MDVAQTTAALRLSGTDPTLIRHATRDGRHASPETRLLACVLYQRHSERLVPLVRDGFDASRILLPPGHHAPMPVRGGSDVLNQINQYFAEACLAWRMQAPTHAHDGYRIVISSKRKRVEQEEKTSSSILSKARADNLHAMQQRISNTLHWMQLLEVETSQFADRVADLRQCLERTPQLIDVDYQREHDRYNLFMAFQNACSINSTLSSMGDLELGDLEERLCSISNLDARDVAGNTMLHHQLRSWFWCESSDWLLMRRPELLHARNNLGQTPILFVACETKANSSLVTIAQRGGNVHDADAQGRTLFHQIIENRDQLAFHSLLTAPSYPVLLDMGARDNLHNETIDQLAARMLDEHPTCHGAKAIHEQIQAYRLFFRQHLLPAIRDTFAVFTPLIAPLVDMTCAYLM